MVQMVLALSKGPEHPKKLLKKLKKNFKKTLQKQRIIIIIIFVLLEKRDWTPKA